MFGELGWLTYLFAIRDVRISFIDAFFKSLERKRKRKVHFSILTSISD
jgi:hypothetical protein